MKMTPTEKDKLKRDWLRGYQAEVIAVLIDALPAEPEKENPNAWNDSIIPPLALDAGDWVEEEAKKFKAIALQKNTSLLEDLIAFGRQCVEHGKGLGKQPIIIKANDGCAAGNFTCAAEVDAAVKAEREECAKIAMRLRFSDEKTIEACCQIVDAIRARK